jgi:hypothetical protein
VTPIDDEQAVAELRDALDACRLAAEGDSNDLEFDCLNDALDLALRRWPELTDVRWPTA